MPRSLPPDASCGERDRSGESERSGAWYTCPVQARHPASGELAIIIGAAVKRLRIEIGWTQRDLAARLGSNLGAIQRLEAGQPHIDSRVASAALAGLGARVAIDTNPIGLAGRTEQRDGVHARCCSHVVGQLERRGWIARSEVEIGEGRFRGWIDILAFRPADRSLLVIEVKTRVDDLGRTLRTLGWYARSGHDAAGRLGWSCRRVVPVLLCLATAETDARIAFAADQLRVELPGRARALLAWIDNPDAPPAQPSLALIDPHGRRRAWLRQTRTDGRRSKAPYLDGRMERQNAPSALTGAAAGIADRPGAGIADSAGRGGRAPRSSTRPGAVPAESAAGSTGAGACSVGPGAIDDQPRSNLS
jgi:transcriptional regulator with XRE-family HTH domain